MEERTDKKLGLSQDAAIVLALADTAVPFAGSLEDEAERWVRVMRLHGWVGAALQAIGVGEAPLETTAHQPIRILRRRRNGENIVETVTREAHELAIARGAGAVCTVDVLFALFATYGKIFDRALYVRGTTREELIERLPADVESGIASG
jgi:hypothetical protein